MRIAVNAIVMIDPLLIDEKPLIANLDLISGNADNALDKIFVRVDWIFKDDDVTPPGFFEWDNGFTQIRYFYSVYKFIDQDVITDLQGLLHGS